MVKMKIKIINLFLILLIILAAGFFLFKNLAFYQQPFNADQLSELYSQSQFAEKPEKRKLIIQDYDLYAYAGYQYLITDKLDQVNIEHPPLGKYLIGLSIFLFKNQNIGQLIFGIIFLLLFYKLSFKITKNTPLSLLLVLIFFQEKIFQEQLTHSLLDLSLGLFLIIFFLSLINQTRKNKLNLIIRGLSLGAIAGIKYPTTAFLVWLTMFFYLFLKKEKGIIRKVFISTFIAIIFFLTLYFPFFIKNPNPLSFYNLQVKALKIHLSHVPEYPKAQVFNVLFLNRWLTWWGNKEYIKTEFWNILWPILTLNFILTLIFLKKTQSNLLINLWSSIYLISLSWRLFFPRYLFLLLPFLYLQSFSFWLANKNKLISKKFFSNKR
jgi:hypothetical protein